MSEDTQAVEGNTKEKKARKKPDAELVAMGRIKSILGGLDPSARARVAAWTTASVAS